MIHTVAVSQLRIDTDGRAYYRRKRAEGTKPLEGWLAGRTNGSRLRRMSGYQLRPSTISPRVHPDAGEAVCRDFQVELGCDDGFHSH